MIERLNQQLSRAKESVNDTISLLISKDTKLVVPTKTADLVKDSDVVTEKQPVVSSSEVKIGEIKLRGKIQLPARKVILDSAALSDLRRNLAVFTC